MAFLGAARLPPCLKNMTGRLVMHDKECSRNKRPFVIVSNTLYLLFIYIYYIYFLSL
jgi:hypothetical protein